MAEGQVTELLNEYLAGGDRQSLDRALPLVYDELRRIAPYYLGRESAGHTLQPTALVNEAYLRLVGQRNVDWRNRAQFFGVAAGLMRRILVNHAEAKRAEKRGGGATRVALDEALAPSGPADLDLLALDEALGRLAERDKGKCRIVELKFFGGLTNEEAAEVVGKSVATVEREWAFARSWLHKELKG